MSLDIARLERAHYRLQSCSYFTEAVDLDGAVAYLTEGISEPEWNHATFFAESTSKAHTTTASLARIEAFYDARGLPPAVEIGPASRPRGLESRLSEWGFERRYRWAWLVPDDAPAAQGPSPGEIQNDDGSVEIHTVASGVASGDTAAARDVSDFLEVFRATYPGGLGSGYERALRRSPSAGCDVVHRVARIGDRPVAVASSIHGRTGDARGVSGLYNLAVHPNWRRRGLGRLLTDVRVDEARRLGHRIFLQTERSTVTNWQRRHGFRLAFTTEGWVRDHPICDTTSIDTKSQDTP